MSAKKSRKPTARKSAAKSAAKPMTQGEAEHAAEKPLSLVKEEASHGKKDAHETGLTTKQLAQRERDINAGLDLSTGARADDSGARTR